MRRRRFASRFNTHTTHARFAYSLATRAVMSFLRGNPTGATRADIERALGSSMGKKLGDMARDPHVNIYLDTEGRYHYLGQPKES